MPPAQRPAKPSTAARHLPILLRDETQIIRDDKRYHARISPSAKKLFRIVFSRHRLVLLSNENLLRDHGKMKGEYLRVRCNSNVVCAEAAIEAQQTFLPRHLLEAVEHTLVRECAIRSPGLLLQARLDEVERQAEERREEAGDCGGRKGFGLWRQIVRRQLRLGLAEESELAEVESHGAYHGRKAAGPERCDAFISADS